MTDEERYTGEIVVLSKIRKELGCGLAPMCADLPEIVREMRAATEWLAENCDEQPKWVSSALRKVGL